MTIMFMYITGLVFALALILWTRRQAIGGWIRRVFGGQNKSRERKLRAPQRAAGKPRVCSTKGAPAQRGSRHKGLRSGRRRAAAPHRGRSGSAGSSLG